MPLDADRDALNLLDATLVALTTQDGSAVPLSIVYENRQEDEPVKPYLDVQVFPVPRDDPTFGALRIIQGIFQVSVVEAKGEGTNRARGYAGIIRDHFGALTLIQSDTLTLTLHKQPQIRGPIHGDDDMRVPVSVFYQTHA